MLPKALRAAQPGSFAVVMATGIVSAALLDASHPHLSAGLLGVAAAAFAILAGASALRAAAFPGLLRDDLACPARAFTCFAFVAACDVLGDRLTADGHDAASLALAVAALAAWLALTALVPGRMAVGYRHPPTIADVSGDWYLWAVSTQSLAIAATFVQAGGFARAQPAAVAAIAAWSAGVALYLAISVAVAVRLARAGLGPQNPTAPYWVTMGAASITVLAAAQILGGPRSPALSAARTGLTAAAVAFWVLATGLIPLLAARSAWRHLFRRQPLRYRSDLWMVVFPAGMYATASMRLGMVAGLPLIHAVGAVAAWPATAAWAVTFTAMLAAPAAARSRARSAGPAGPRGPSPPARRSRRSRRNRRQLTS